MKIKPVLALTLSLVSFTAFADVQVPADWTSFWQKYDVNQDQKISKEEFNKVQDFAPFSYSNDLQGSKQHEKIFNQLDQNHDGYVNVQEFNSIENVISAPLYGWNWRSDIATHF